MPAPHYAKRFLRSPLLLNEMLWLRSLGWSTRHLTARFGFASTNAVREQCDRFRVGAPTVAPRMNNAMSLPIRALVGESAQRIAARRAAISRAAELDASGRQDGGVWADAPFAGGYAWTL